VTRYNRAVLALAVAALALVGCAQQDTAVIDQCLRREIFAQCLSAVPPGPQDTKYNDWSEVVSECGSQAYYQAQRYPKHVKPECAR
jgi:hypothetical protein